MNIYNTAICFTDFITFCNEIIFRIAKRLPYSLLVARSQPQPVKLRLTRRGTRRITAGLRVTILR